MTPAQIRLFVDTHFTAVSHRNAGDELVFICPQPGCQDKTGNRSVNVKTGKTGCFRCNVNGTFVRWARKLGYEVEEDDNTVSSASELTELLVPAKRELTVPGMSAIKLPPGCLRVADEPKSAYTKAIRLMAESKQLELADMVEADVHFTRTDWKWEPYAIFPIKEWDRLVLYQGRLVSPDGMGLKKRFPSNQEVKLGAKYWVYNIDELRATPGAVVIVVESILNVLSLRKQLRAMGVTGMVPVCVFKHAISSAQLTKILRCKPSEACILYDADSTQAARKQAAYIVNQVRCTVAEMPWTAERPTLDANDDVVLALEAIANRQPVKLSSTLVI